MAEISVSREGGLALVTIQRAAKRNVLTDEGIAQLGAAFDGLEADASVRCVLLRGEGTKAFSAGYDLSGAGNAPQTGGLHVLLERIERYPSPVVAYLRGYAIGGGCELAMACDIRVAGDDVRMGMPPARLGVIYPLAGHARFFRTVGLAAASEIFFSGRLYTASDCLRLGLISVLKPAAESEGEALQLAREISENAPLSLRGTKRMLRHLAAGPAASGEDESELAALFSRSLTTRDLAEGKSAFAEGRKPVFTGT